ncbi:hypothetical protein QBC39DRAFT_252327, partial [Podospora conica]
GRTIYDKAKAIRIKYNIPYYLFLFIVNSVVKVKNLILLLARNNKSSYEILFESLNIPKEASTLYIKYLRSYFYNTYYYVKPAYRT